MTLTLHIGIFVSSVKYHDEPDQMQRDREREREREREEEGGGGGGAVYQQNRIILSTGTAT